MSGPLDDGWRMLHDPQDGREYLVPNASVWEVAARNEIDTDTLELVLRNPSTRETTLVVVKAIPE